MRRYNDLSHGLKTKFGERVFKVSLTAQTTCPNIDGTLSTGGCSFCNDAAYAPLSENRRSKPVTEQLEEGMAYIRKRHASAKFIAYFQSFTSTYGDFASLLAKFQESLRPPEVVGFALSTRPDCVTAEWAKALDELAREKLGWIELGLQSAHDRTLARVNRWETRRQFETACALLKRHSRLPICVHTVLGLPGEGPHEALETVRYLTAQPIDGLKIHNLHVVKGTRLAQEYREGKYRPLSLEAYASLAADCLEWTPPRVVIHRLNAHAPRQLTIAPDWSVNKLAVFNAVEKEMEKRDSWQGKALGFPVKAVSLSEPCS